MYIPGVVLDQAREFWVLAFAMNAHALAWQALACRALWGC
jgi:hypothetical protein